MTLKSTRNSTVENPGDSATTSREGHDHGSSAAQVERDARGRHAMRLLHDLMDRHASPYVKSDPQAPRFRVR